MPGKRLVPKLAVFFALFALVSLAQAERSFARSKPEKPLEPSAKEGFVRAPIHSDSIVTRLVPGSLWPHDRPKPFVHAKSLYIAWDGQSKTPKGHPFPTLYATIEIAVPAGAELTTKSNRQLGFKPRTKTPAGDMDVYGVNLPVVRMDFNSVDFHVKFYRGTVAEFSLEYQLKLDETYFEMHKSCDEHGVKVRELSSGKLSAFLLARCRVEDGVLYINILKPLDRVFALENTSKQLLETERQPVVRVELPQDTVIHRAIVGEMMLRDEAQRQQERFEVVYEPTVRPQRVTLNVGLSPGFVAYRESFSRLSISEAVLTAKATLAVKIIPGLFDGAVSGYATALPIILHPDDRPAARWIGLNYRFGLNLPVRAGATSFQLLGGWYQWFMSVANNEYGVANIQGPQIFIAVTHKPLGQLGWMGYFKFAPMADGFDGLDFGKLGRREIAFGAAHDVPWFGETRRRPALTFDFAQLNVVIKNVEISQTSVSLGLSYPLL